MKSIFNQHIGIFENAISDEWCDLTIKLMDDHTKNLGMSRDQYWQGDSMNVQDLAMDLFLIFEKGKDKRTLNIKKEFDKSIEKVYKLYKKKYLLNTPGYRIDNYHLQKTNPTEGYHVWHYESPSWLPKKYSNDLVFHNTSRFAAYTVYLNDVDEGGETEFLFQSKRVPARKGTICLFPSSYTHLHRGNPPLSNSKYIMTGWLHVLKIDNE